MFSDNEHLKKFVEPSKEEKRKAIEEKRNAILEQMARKMIANSFYGAYVPDHSCVVTTTNFVLEAKQNVEDVF